VTFGLPETALLRPPFCTVLHCTALLRCAALAEITMLTIKKGIVAATGLKKEHLQDPSSNRKFGMNGMNHDYVHTNTVEAA
jgi:hypothetical protein